MVHPVKWQFAKWGISGPTERPGPEVPVLTEPMRLLLLGIGDDLFPPDQTEPLSNAPDVSSSFQPELSTVDVSLQEPVLSAAAHDARFSSSLLTNCSVSSIELPWETDFYRDLFDDSSNSSVVPKMPVEDLCAFDIEAGPQDVASAVAGVARHSDSNLIHTMFVSCSDDFDFYAQRKRVREAAIGKLFFVLRHCLLASETGRHIIALGNDAQQTADAYDIVDAVVGIKSAATLVKRANALLSFLRWFAREGHTDVNPFEEKFAWLYFMHLRESGAPPTRADSALSAFRFARHVLGFECLESTVESRRLAGLCEIMLSGKRLLRQALPLTVCHIKRLHGILVDEDVHGFTSRTVL
eukprot:s231_g20.t1